jgi:hypothetical protein
VDAALCWNHEDFPIRAKGLQSLFLHFQTRGLNLLRRLAGNRTESGIDELHSSEYSENLYNRVSIFGIMDMSDAVISDVKNFFLLLMVNTGKAC